MAISTHVTKSKEYLTKEVTATIHTILKWHKICNDSKGSFVCGRETETKDFVTTITSPKIFTPSIESINMAIFDYPPGKVKQDKDFL